MNLSPFTSKNYSSVQWSFSFLQKYNFPDTVIWNPWVEKAKEIQDFGDDEFPNLICVESGHVSSPVTLMPGTAFEASQILQVM